VNTATLLSKNSPLLRTRSLEGSFSIAEAVELFAALANLDEHNDRRRKLCKIATILGVVLTAFLLLADLAPVAVFTGVGSIVLAVLVFRLGHLDIPNDVRLFVLPWLRILSADMEAGTSVALKLDLHEANHKSKRAADVVSSGKQWQTYHHPWFSGQATLADGARLQWNAVTNLRQHTAYKRKGRTKTKVKQAITYDVALGLPAASFATTELAIRGTEKVRVKPGDKRNVVRVSHVAAATSMAPANLDDLIAAVASAYRQAAPKPATEQSA
jgi:hypothetical protein